MHASKGSPKPIDDIIPALVEGADKNTNIMGTVIGKVVVTLLVKQESKIIVSIGPDSLLAFLTW